ERTSLRQRPVLWLADLTQLRRQARERTLEPFPPEQPNPPHVAAGSLIIVGGGGMPPGLMERFIELAGGADRARLVYVPCAEEEWVSPRQSMVEDWRKMGVRKTAVGH